jgi:hypothetical protein
MLVCAAICFIPPAISLLAFFNGDAGQPMDWQRLRVTGILAIPSLGLLALIPGIRGMHLWAYYAACAFMVPAAVILAVLSPFSLCTWIPAIMFQAAVVTLLSTLIPDLRTFHRQEKLRRQHGFEPIMPASSSPMKINLPRPTLNRPLGRTDAEERKTSE